MRKRHFERHYSERLGGLPAAILGAHARDELGLSKIHRARPTQSALVSAVTFTTGTMLPVILVAIAPINSMIVFVAVSSLVFLGILGSIAAKAGGAIVAHSAKTPARVPNKDFVIPNVQVIENIVKYMLSDNVCSVNH